MKPPKTAEIPAFLRLVTLHFGILFKACTYTMSRENKQSLAVLSAIADLTNTDRRAHRETIAEVTGLKLFDVDYSLKRLRANEQIKLIERGVYALVPAARQDRAISITLLPDGYYKVEIGDAVLDLTSREARGIGTLLSGVSIQFGMAGAR